MKSIRSKILLVTIISVLISSSLIGFILIQQAYEPFAIEAVKRLESVTSKHANEINTELYTIEQAAMNLELVVESVFSFEDLVMPGYMDQLEVLLEPVVLNYARTETRSKSAYVFFLPSLDGQIHDVWFADLEGDGVRRMEKFPMDFYDAYDQGEEWFFIPKETLAPFWTSPYQGNYQYDDFVTYVSHTRPIVVDGQFIGVTGADYFFNELEDDIVQIEVFEKGYGLLLNENMEVIVHPFLEEYTNLDTFNDGEFKSLNDAFRGSESGTIYYEWLDKKDKILVFQRLDNNWTFAVTIEEDAIFSQINHLITLMVLITLGSTLIIAMLVYRITAYVINDLEVLKEHVEIIGHGNYDQMMPRRITGKRDETGDLAVNIERMRVRQKESFEALRHYNERLEAEIEVRTKSLKESNENLAILLKENEENNEELTALNDQLSRTMKEMEITQRQLIESEKIASLSFMGTKLSHEFNTPLGNCTTLMTFLNDEHEKIQKKYQENTMTRRDLTAFMDKYNNAYKMIMQNMGIIKELVNRFKEMDPTSHVTIKSKVNIRHFISVILDSVVIADHIEVEILCDPILEVDIDAGKFSQIIYQLVENAVVHGLSPFQEGMITIDVQMKEKLLNMVVKDNGAGMSPQMIEQIFVPFYTGSLNTERSGLGLNIVYNLITNYFKGQIICDSSPDKGTEFKILMNLE